MYFVLVLHLIVAHNLDDHGVDDPLEDLGSIRVLNVYNCVRCLLIPALDTPTRV